METHGAEYASPRHGGSPACRVKQSSARAGLGTTGSHLPRERIVAAAMTDCRRVHPAPTLHRRFACVAIGVTFPLSLQRNAGVYRLHVGDEPLELIEIRDRKRPAGMPDADLARIAVFV